MEIDNITTFHCEYKNGKKCKIDGLTCDREDITWIEKMLNLYGICSTFIYECDDDIPYIEKKYRKYKNGF